MKILERTWDICKFSIIDCTLHFCSWAGVVGSIMAECLESFCFLFFVSCNDEADKSLLGYHISIFGNVFNLRSSKRTRLPNLNIFLTKGNLRFCYHIAQIWLFACTCNTLIRLDVIMGALGFIYLYPSVILLACCSFTQ